jgi:hypothetical protein
MNRSRCNSQSGPASAALDFWPPTTRFQSSAQGAENFNHPKRKKAGLIHPALFED